MISKIDPSKIAFDIDDVFADTMALFLQIARDEYHLSDLRHEDITSYMVEDCIDVEAAVLEGIFAKILDGSRTASLRPMKGAAEVVARIGRSCSPVLFVTARPSLDSIIDWIRSRIPLTPDSVEVVATGSFDGKAEVLLEKKISYFVEDRLETCFTLAAAGITPILFRQPWNRGRHPFAEVGSWAELETWIAFNGKGR